MAPTQLFGALERVRKNLEKESAKGSAPFLTLVIGLLRLPLPRALTAYMTSEVSQKTYDPGPNSNNSSCLAS